MTDRSGAAVLEFILCDDSYQRSYTGAVELPELVATVCWYLWWQRRQLVRGDDVQTPERIAPAVIALALNYARATGITKVTPSGWFFCQGSRY